MFKFSSRKSSVLQSLALLSVATFAILAILLGCGIFRFGSIDRTIAFLQGNTIHVEAPFKTINVALHQPFEVEYKVVNLSSASIKLVGAELSCTCTSVDNLPMTLEPLQAKTLKVNLSALESNKELSGTVRLFTTDETCRSLLLEFTGHPVQ